MKRIVKNYFSFYSHKVDLFRIVILEIDKMCLLLWGLNPISITNLELTLIVLVSTKDSRFSIGI